MSSSNSSTTLSLYNASSIAYQFATATDNATTTTTSYNGSIPTPTTFVTPYPDPTTDHVSPVSWLDSLPVQLTTLTAFITLTCILFIHLAFHSRRHMQGSMINWILQVGSALTILGGQSTEMQRITFFLRKQIMYEPNVLQPGALQTNHDLSSSLWRSFQVLFIYLCQLHLITLFFTRRYQINLTLGVYGTLAVVSIVSSFLELAENDDVSNTASQIHNIIRTTISFLFFITFLFWSLYHRLLNPKSLRKTIRFEDASRPALTNFYVSNIQHWSVSDTLFWGYFTLTLAFMAIGFTFLETLAAYIIWATDLRTVSIAWANWASFWWWLGTLDIVQEGKRLRKQQRNAANGRVSVQVSQSGSRSGSPVVHQNGTASSNAANGILNGHSQAFEMQRLGSTRSNHDANAAAEAQSQAQSQGENAQHKPVVTWLNMLFRHATSHSQLHPSSSHDSPRPISISSQSHSSPPPSQRQTHSVTHSSHRGSQSPPSVIHPASEPQPSIRGSEPPYHPPSEPSVHYHLPLPSAPPSEHPSDGPIGGVPMSASASAYSNRMASTARLFDLHDHTDHHDHDHDHDVAQHSPPPPTYSVSISASETSRIRASPIAMTTSLSENVPMETREPPPQYPDRSIS